MTEETKAETLLGFCVLGGVFSEGIDLTRDSLIRRSSSEQAYLRSAMTRKF